ncbi:hypothetical protein [Enorma massiliensis]|uniref:hypothetical protein n=1 Tax=Enorma massiliensis TaxID=1472761 RepID=UPI003A8F8CBF
MSKVDAVDKYVSRIDEEISDGKASGSAAVLVRDIVGLFSDDIPGIKRGLDRYRQRIWVSGMPGPEIDNLHDLQLLREKLLMFRGELIGDAPGTPSSGGGTGPLNIYLDNSATQTVSADSHATATATTAVTVTQTIEALESCSLSPEELSEMKAAIAELEAAKGKAPETICEKASKLLDLAKKGTDTAKAVAPYVASALSALGTIL